MSWTSWIGRGGGVGAFSFLYFIYLCCFVAYTLQLHIQKTVSFLIDPILCIELLSLNTYQVHLACFVRGSIISIGKVHEILSNIYHPTLCFRSLSQDTFSLCS